MLAEDVVSGERPVIQALSYLHPDIVATFPLHRQYVFQTAMLYARVPKVDPWQTWKRE